MILNNRVYDVLKVFCMRWFPAIITFTGLVLNTWSICTEQMTSNILITMTGFNTLLGVFLGISNENYKSSMRDE